ncbi:MAG: tRNA-dihydrouridine synthase [Candidatus Nealsonbacteria bacterium]|nr:tRNA-dihydrouridine synthase [Candidatus Nealsonbacteria bacterium]
MTSIPTMTLQLPQLRLGSLELDFPVVQAALAGYSDWPMRVIARRLGAPYTMAEVLLDRFVLSVSRGRKVGRYIRVTDEERPCGAQLMGSASDECAAAAVKLVEAGFDVIDVNFGCPVKKVIGKGRGGYLLGEPKTAIEIVARVRDAVPPEVPVTVKMRRGVDDSRQSRDNFYTIFDGVFQHGAAAVIVHGRTVRQRYDGKSSWQFVREVKRHAGDRTVLGSGDLFTARKCLEMIAQTGVDGVTAARGAIGNPWIFQQARALAAGLAPIVPTLEQQRDVLVEHFRLAEATHGPTRACRRMRKFGIEYSRLHPQPDAVRAAFLTIANPVQWRKTLEQWYTEP